jgi:hypothetical protein
MQHQDFCDRFEDPRGLRQVTCAISISKPQTTNKSHSIVTAALAMLHKFCCLHATSVAFPELVLPLHKVNTIMHAIMVVKLQ